MNELVPINFDNRDSFNRVDNVRKDVMGFRFSNVRVPEGWNFTLVSALAEREVTRTDNTSRMTEVRYYNNILLTYRIGVPAGYKTGPESLSATVVNPKGKSEEVAVRVDVIN